jgi:hypothetical protein
LKSEFFGDNGVWIFRSSRVKERKREREREREKEEKEKLWTKGDAWHRCMVRKFFR